MFKKTLITTAGVVLIAMGVYTKASATALDIGEDNAVTVNNNAISVSLSNGVDGVYDLTPSGTTTTQAVVATGHEQGTRMYAAHSDGGSVVAKTKTANGTLDFGSIADADAASFPADTDYTTGSALSN